MRRHAPTRRFGPLGHGPGRRRRVPRRRAAHRHPRRRPAGLQGAHADRRPARRRAAPSRRSSASASTSRSTAWRALGLKGDVQGGGLFGIARRERLEGRPPGSLARRAPRPGRHRAPRRRPGMTRALLLDLDDTLIVEEPAAVAAFAATAARGGRAPPARPAPRWRSTPARGRASSGARRRTSRVLPAHRDQLVGGACGAATRATATSCARCASGRRGSAATPGARALADQGVEDDELAGRARRALRRGAPRAARDLRGRRPRPRRARAPTTARAGDQRRLVLAAREARGLGAGRSLRRGRRLRASCAGQARPGRLRPRAGARSARAPATR